MAKARCISLLFMLMPLPFTHSQALARFYSGSDIVNNVSHRSVMIRFIASMRSAVEKKVPFGLLTFFTRSYPRPGPRF